MTRGFVIGGVVTLVLAGMQPHARTPPNFSGTWVSAGPRGSSACRKSFTATQDAATLSLDFAGVSVSQRDNPSPPPAPSSRRVIYNFDGTDTREAFPPAAPRPSNAPPAAWIATTVASVARAAWNGDQLIIVTHRTTKITWPSQMPAEFDRQQTFREALSLDANGHMVVDRIAIVDPLPGGTTARLDVPTSWTCTYKKAR
jgi:hypothetical protein